MKRLIFILSLVFLASCSKNYISVYDKAIYSDYLASVKMGTPDERNLESFLGERLIVSWDIPKELFSSSDHWELIHKIRFGNREEIESRYVLDRHKGSFKYDLLDEEYYEKKGISTYKVELYNEDGLKEIWKHQVWVDYIKIE